MAKKYIKLSTDPITASFEMDQMGEVEKSKIDRIRQWFFDPLRNYATHEVFVIFMVCLPLYEKYLRYKKYIGKNDKFSEGHSVLNRMADSRYPDTACEVIKQAKYHGWDMINPIRYQCQYSWFCDGLSDKPQNGKAMLEATILAQHVLAGKSIDITEGATHYHADYVHPYWADEMTTTIKLGSHIYYR